MSPVQSALSKVAVSAAVLIIVFARMRFSRRHGLAEFGFARPKLGPALVMLAAYMGWMLLSDAVLHWRGPWDFRPWQQAPLAASVMRVVAVCMLGPAAEELLFRGLLFRRLGDHLPVAAVIVIAAVGWALLHWSYSWAVIGVIVIDGLLLGLARWRTGSIAPPIVMHALYNLYAIW
jgi:membrane protease YdiL (CAAX protease family)